MEEVVAALRRLPNFPPPPPPPPPPTADAEEVTVVEEAVTTSYLLLIAQGRVQFGDVAEHWLPLRNALGWAIRRSLRESFTTRGFLDRNPNSDFKSREREIEHLLVRHEVAPFSLQRCCEILYVPNTRPLATHKLINCLEKNLRCSSC